MKEHLDIFFECLSDEYESIVAEESSHFDPLSIKEVEMLFLAHQ